MSLLSTMVDRSASRPLSAICFKMPGCGNSATSGASLPWTLVLISWLKLPVCWNLTVTAFWLAQALTSFLKPSSCPPEKAYMTEIVLLVLSFPPPPPELRQPAVNRATAPAVATAPIVDLMRMCTPSDTCSFRSASGEAAVRRVGSGAARRPEGRRPLADGRGSGLDGGDGDVAGDAAAGLGREHVHFVGRDVDVDLLALHRHPLGVDAEGEQLVAAATALAEVQVAVGV